MIENYWPQKNSPILYGEANHAAKLTWCKAHAIRKAYAKGNTSYTKLSKRHGVSRQAIAFVILGKTWKEQQLPKG